LRVGLYLAAVFMFWASLYLYVPTLPVYVQSKTEDLSVVGVVLAMYGLWQAVIRLPLGIAADWLGRRKPFIIAGFALTGLGAWLLGMADGVNALIVGRSVTGLAAAAWVPLVAMFSSMFPAGEAVRATAMLTLVASTSRMLATGVAGSLNEIGGYSLPFFLAAGVASLAIFFVLPVNERRREPKAPDFGEVGRLVSRRDVLLPASLNALNQYSAWAASFSFFPILARQLGARDVTLSILASMNIGVVLLANLLTTAFIRRIGPQRLVIISFIFQATGIGVAALATSLWHVFVAQVCMGAAGGTGYPVLMGMSIEHVDADKRTTAMGLHQAVYAIGMFVGPWLSGILADALGVVRILPGGGR
jgi:MFS family permease